MKDSVAELVEAATHQREPYVVATVVRVRGSSYRRPGARLIATARGERVAGSISGGCLEGALLRTAWWRTEGGPVVVEFDSSDPDSTDGVLGCGGVIEVLVERVAPGTGALPYAGACLANQRRGAIATVFATTRAGEPIGQRWFATDPAMPAMSTISTASAMSTVPAISTVSAMSTMSAMSAMSAMPAELAVACERAMTSGRASVEHVGAWTVLVEPIVPPLSLFVFGAGLDAVPIVEGARRLGWDAHVWSGAPRFEHATRFAAASSISHDLGATCAAIERADRAAAIVMSHDLRRDAEALAAVLATRARYIGVLGPRHRTESLSPLALADPRVHAPVGLDLGAETPAEIAVAVVAEVLADDRAATARALRDRAIVAATRLVLQ